MGISNVLELQLMGGTFGGGAVDLSVVLAFIVFAGVAFLAPVVGYRRRPAGVTAALCLLAGHVALSVLQATVTWYLVIDGMGPGGGGGRDPLIGYTVAAFAVLKPAVFCAALVCFIFGMRSLQRRKRRHPAPAAPQPAAPTPPAAGV